MNGNYLFTRFDLINHSTEQQSEISWVVLLHTLRNYGNYMKTSNRYEQFLDDVNLWSIFVKSLKNKMRTKLIHHTSFLPPQADQSRRRQK